MLLFGVSAAEIINSAILGNAAVAQPQSYALVSCCYCMLLNSTEYMHKFVCFGSLVR